MVEQMLWSILTATSSLQQKSVGNISSFLDLFSMRPMSFCLKPVDASTNISTISVTVPTLSGYQPLALQN
jgi:hypothetical protein